MIRPVRGGVQEYEGDAACGPESTSGGRQCHRWTDDATCRIRSQSAERKRVEESFGWMKTIARMRKLRHRGLPIVGWMFTFAAAAYNLVRMRNLTAAVPTV